MSCQVKEIKDTIQRTFWFKTYRKLNNKRVPYKAHVKECKDFDRRTQTNLLLTAILNIEFSINCMVA